MVGPRGRIRLRVGDSVSREFLLGRRAPTSLAAYWPNASEEEQVIAEPLNKREC